MKLFLLAAVVAMAGATHLGVRHADNLDVPAVRRLLYRPVEERHLHPVEDIDTLTRESTVFAEEVVPSEKNVFRKVMPTRFAVPEEVPSQRFSSDVADSEYVPIQRSYVLKSFQPQERRFQTQYVIPVESSFASKKYVVPHEAAVISRNLYPRESSIQHLHPLVRTWVKKSIPLESSVQVKQFFPLEQSMLTKEYIPVDSSLLAKDWQVATKRFIPEERNIAAKDFVTKQFIPVESSLLAKDVLAKDLITKEYIPVDSSLLAKDWQVATKRFIPEERNIAAKDLITKEYIPVDSSLLAKDFVTKEFVPMDSSALTKDFVAKDFVTKEFTPMDSNIAAKDTFAPLKSERILA